MRFPLYIAKRYFFSRKSHHIINYISGISIAGITIGTLALVIVLSVFNGFEDLVIRLFNSFNPDLEISLVAGKTFNAGEIPADEIKKIPGVVRYAEVIEENVLLKYKTKQYIAVLKGVSEGYLEHNPLDTMMVGGKFMLESGNGNFAVLGYGVAWFLGVDLNDYKESLTVYSPRRGRHLSIQPEEAFNALNIFPSGVFSIQQDFDSKYMLVPLRFARGLLDYRNELSSVEISLGPRADLHETQQEVQKLAGDRFRVKNRFQQQELLYKIMKSEKWAIFFILTFILVIATFNVIGSLTMLILDKKKDAAVLFSLGADKRLIRRIFLTEGWMISLIGALLGLLLGLLICWIQQRFGILQLNSDHSSFVVNAYPVKVRATDLLWIFLTVCGIGFVAAWIPAARISESYLGQKL